jgi:two-component system sensor histidine kinase FlrB
MDNNILEVVHETFTEIINDYEALEARAIRLNSMLTVINAKQKEEIEKRARISQRLETLLKILPGGVIVLDQNGVIIESNLAATNILGIHELIDKRWVDIIEQSYTPKLDDGLEVSLRNGKRISVATNALPEELGQIILITDLTKTRELQAKINQQNKLSAMGEMISSLAHQIKTPLASALLYTSHLSNKNIDAIRQQLYADRIKERLMYLDDLLQSMLIYVKGYIPTIDTVEVTKLLTTMCNGVEDLIKEKKMNLLVCNEVGNKQFLGNLTAFVSALVNLIINSIQASAPGSYICVFAKEYNHKSIDIIVSDKGSGISEDNLPKVFQAFFSTKTTGTGLGLSVVEIVAQAGNGSVWIESSRETGTKIGIRVPCIDKNNDTICCDVTGEKIRKSA